MKISSAKRWLSEASGSATFMEGSLWSKMPAWLTGMSGPEPRNSYAAPSSNEHCSVGRLTETRRPPEPPPNPTEPVNHAEIGSVIDEMLRQSRYALLLRPQLIRNLTPEQASRARAALADGMCLVPEGQVVMRRGVASGEPGKESVTTDGPQLHVDAYYLDRFPVTNAQFHQFVASGGYEQMAIWDPEIWPALLDFVDQTGHPGPRLWRNGRPTRGEDHHPVVGVCWYEAMAYSRWAGKRLPSDVEWVKAGSWPVSIQGHPLLMRRYPWGEAMDRARANLWGSGPGRTVGVHEFPGGVSVGGVHQLIGNVWEWTADCYAPDGLETSGGTVHTKMKSLRGGAFDTYLDSQATCQFQSADVALARKHNIGFRSAIHLSDLSLRQETYAEEPEEEPETSLAEDVS